MTWDVTRAMNACLHAYTLVYCLRWQSIWRVGSPPNGIFILGEVGVTETYLVHQTYIQYSRLYDMGTELQVYRYIVSGGMVYIYICECIEAYICVYTYVCM